MSDYAKFTARAKFSRNSDYSDPEQDTHTMNMTLTPDECKHGVIDVYITGGNPAAGNGSTIMAADEFTDVTAVLLKNNDATNFMTITVGDDKIGVGGFWTQFAKVTSRLLETAWDADARESFLGDDTVRTNPLIRWVRSRSAPFPGLGWDMAAGEDFLGRQIEGPLDWAEHLRNQTTPIWLEAAVLSEPYKSGWPGIAGEVGGIMYLWNAPDSGVPVINFTYERKIQIVQSADDTVDYPDYAHEYIINNLAKRLILKFGCSMERTQIIRADAKETKDAMLAYGASMYPISIKMVRS